MPAQRVSPLNEKVAMVDLEGRPTPQFMQWWQQFLAKVNPLSNSTGVSDLLDLLGSTRGSLLVRGANGWAILTPGTSGHVLISQGPDNDPSYGAISATFLSLTDTPADYTDQALKGVRVNAAEDALEFFDIPGGAATGPTGYATYTPVSGSFTHVSETAISGDELNETDSLTGRPRIFVRGTNNFCRAYTALSGLDSDFDLVAVLELRVPNDNFASAGVLLRNSTSNRSVYFGFTYEQLSFRKDFSGSAFNAEENGTLDVIADQYTRWYIRLVRSSDSITVSYSKNGRTFIPSGLTAYSVSFLENTGSINQIGIGMDTPAVAAATETYVELLGYDLGGIQPELLGQVSS